MVRQQQDIFQWTFRTLGAEPELFGSDNGNALIIQRYIYDAVGIHISENTISNSVSASRCKNNILLNMPEWDFRKKNLPKTRKKEHTGQGVFDFDAVTPEPQTNKFKICKHFNDNPKSWKLSDSRVANSIRGVKAEEIKCFRNWHEAKDANVSKDRDL